ncbi:MAG: AlpA family transcriptional regulator [Pseudomonadota bacterium]|nr:AlpA family transcriptional regulator [Pseudomonadota bacterium]
MDTFMRLPAVKVRTGLSRSSIYAKMKTGEFPQAIALGQRSIGWIESEIQQWIVDRVKASREITR